jgi:hypothetical protein
MRRTWNLEGSSYTWNLERFEGSSNGASLSEGIHEGDLQGGLVTGDPKGCVKALEMGMFFCRGPNFGEHGGTLFVRAFKRKNSYQWNFCAGFKTNKNAL